jgi:hypothetical protein
MNDNSGFRNAAAAQNARRSSADNMLTESNEKFDFFRGSEIRNRHRIYEHPNRAGRAHKTGVTFDDKAACVRSLR